MKRSGFMNRGSGFKRHPASKRAPRLDPLVPKALGRSAVDKRPETDDAHLQKVRDHGCLVCGRAAEAHHPRELFLRTGGLHISDYLAVPLCPEHHKVEYPGSLHYFNTSSWWITKGIDVIEWLREFTKESCDALKRYPPQPYY